MASSSEQELRVQIGESAGVDASWASFGVVTDQLDQLRQDVAKVRTHPLIGERAKVGGFLYDVDSGLLTEHVLSRPPRPFSDPRLTGDRWSAVHGLPSSGRA